MHSQISWRWGRENSTDTLGGIVGIFFLALATTLITAGIGWLGRRAIADVFAAANFGDCHGFALIGYGLFEISSKEIQANAALNLGCNRNSKVGIKEEEEDDQS